MKNNLLNLHKAIFAFLCLICSFVAVHAQQKSNLNDTVILLKEVSVKPKFSLTSPDMMQALALQRRIAGSTSLVEIRPDNQRIATIKDALKMQPGVMIQEFFGSNDQPRLNVRGSGIQSNPQRRGVYLLQDGIPVNFSDGSYVVGLFNRETAAATRSVELSKLGLSGTYKVRDLWKHADEGEVTDKIEAVIPAHGCKIIKLTK